MKRKFIVNPTARNGALRRHLPRIAAEFAETPGGFDPIVTESWEDAQEQTRRALIDGAQQIVVLGGDGTLNAAVNGFFEAGRPIRPDAVLVATNWGTGSDYFKTVAPGFRGGLGELVLRGEPRPADLGVIETSGGPPRFFLNMASTGLSAEVVSRKLTLPLPDPLVSALSYTVPAVRALFTYRGWKGSVRAPGLSFDGQLLALFAAKGTFAGGGLRLGGHVTPDDGRLDVTLLEEMRLARRIGKFCRLLRNGLPAGRSVIRAQVPWIEVSGPHRPVEFDGEVRAATPVRISVRTKAVQVCCPSKKNLY
jgi:diacylglycerol kinase family enzyme